ncbi:hybrid sensor histidine kinase/response regulator [Enterovibrio norvegicus FF-162]|uniref:Sensory/regulatory protein RpfC n=1 Tax=Enterovibrio norvegicus FF-454 TaxID=1185651 RepID=A0A1E5C9U1_9GAMM|nr:hybrid sensor histidine kinase/response regulator [Enterovibrio norvegicus]OEE62236.1 hybrid sensor histidine kinase/response regulator [Enterovibrio norvegicus FF-454]OEE89147.1 hybrid sensor histidine kinase/response regulator [Enterovibrio norvegicus FF-162]
MSENQIQRDNQFPFSKSIVGKVGFIMAMMTLCAMLLSVSTYVMHDTASTDTTNTRQLEIPRALLSVSMLRFVGEMNRNMLSYALGESASLDTYFKNKNQFEVSLKELNKIHGDNASKLHRIESNYKAFETKIESEVLRQYDPQREKWAMNEKKLIKKDLAPELNRAIQALLGLDVSNDTEINVDNHQVIWLMREDAEDMMSSVYFYLNGEDNQIQHFHENAAFFSNYLQQLRAMSTNEQYTLNLDEIERIINDLVTRTERIFSEYDPLKKNEAIHALKTINNNEYKTLETSLTTFSRETSFSAANSMASLHKVLKNNQISFFGLFAIMTLVSIALTVYIYKKVTQPIARLADTMRNLADGNTEIPILYKNRPDEVGQISHALSSFRDHIISRNQAREQLLYQKELAEAASKTKAQFLAAMSHEIRTPMNGVIGMIDILRRSKLDATQMGVATTVRDSALSLLSIINDILDFSRIEAGKMRIDDVPLSLRNIAEQVMDNLATEATDKNVSLTLYISPSVPTCLSGDPTRIRQILFNLIGNGIKFSGGQPHRGEVQVWIKNQPEHNNHSSISIEIRDNGIGISQDKLEAIFKPFTQAEYSTTRRYGGSGLGLAISQNIVSLMGGSIRAESEEGIGSIFTVSFELPVADNINIPENCNIDLLRESAQTLSSVICVNTLENGALKTSIDNYLQQLNISCHSTSVELLHQQKFERSDVKYVVICRDYLQTKQLMPPFLSSSVEIRYLELDMQLPVHRYGGIDVFAVYASPLKLSMLLSGLRICVGLESPDYPALDTSTREAFIERTDQEQGTILVAEDNVTNQTVINKQLTYLGYKVVMTGDGLEALRAYRKQAFTLVLTDCHMPNMDGYELTHAIRAIQKERNEFVPIIALTANALVGEAERCIETGMNDFIAKPVEIDVIQKVLSKWCSKSKPFEEISSPTSVALNVSDPLIHETALQEVANTDTARSENMIQETALPQVEVELEASVLQKLFWGDKETYADVLGEFIKHCVPELTDLAMTHAPYDFDQIKASAHKLKTSSRSIGAFALSDLCISLEQSADAKSNDIESLIFTLNEQLDGTISAVKSKRIALTHELDHGKVSTPDA